MSLKRAVILRLASQTGAPPPAVGVHRCLTSQTVTTPLTALAVPHDTQPHHISIESAPSPAHPSRGLYVISEHDDGQVRRGRRGGRWRQGADVPDGSPPPAATQPRTAHTLEHGHPRHYAAVRVPTSTLPPQAPTARSAVHFIILCSPATILAEI